mgnify:CR=1 FL=1
MSLKKTSKIQRGLWWIYRQASADLETASGDKAGVFGGTTEKEVEEALEWLKKLLDGDGNG